MDAGYVARVEAKLNAAYDYLVKLREDSRGDISIREYGRIRDKIEKAEKEYRHYLGLMNSCEFSMYGKSSVSATLTSMQDPRSLHRYFGYPSPRAE